MIKEIETFIADLGISNHPGLKVDESLQGYRDWTFGCRAGPVEANVDDLAHELAHAIQFGAKQFRRRAFEFGFNFKVPRKWVYDRFVVEPITNQATMRELETFAIQAHLMGINSGSIIEFAKSRVESMKYMPDSYCIPGQNISEQESWMADRVIEFFDATSKGECINELNKWLDATDKMFKRKQK